MNVGLWLSHEETKDHCTSVFRDESHSIFVEPVER
jgi:hypothetical protein